MAEAALPAQRPAWGFSTACWLCSFRVRTPPHVTVRWSGSRAGRGRGASAGALEGRSFPGLGSSLGAAMEPQQSLLGDLPGAFLGRGGAQPGGCSVFVGYFRLGSPDVEVGHGMERGVGVESRASFLAACFAQSQETTGTRCCTPVIPALREAEAGVCKFQPSWAT